MNKSDLKDGFVVEFLGGALGVIYNGYICQLNGITHNLKHFTESLRGELSPDIEKVGHSSEDNIISKVKEDNRMFIEWIWERETYEITQEEYGILSFMKERSETFNINVDENHHDIIVFFDKDDENVGYLRINSKDFLALDFKTAYDIKDVLNNFEICERR